MVYLSGKSRERERERERERILWEASLPLTRVAGWQE
jgi:hypothetical protein